MSIYYSFPKGENNPAKRDSVRKILSEQALKRHGHKDRSIPAFNALYRTYQDSANFRNLEFILSKDDFRELTSGDCYYCGEKPKQIRRNGRKTSPHPSFYIYNGVDRVDNNIGYQKFNCVSCCNRCNKMKRAINVEVFINHSIKIAKKWENK